MIASIYKTSHGFHFKMTFGPLCEIFKASNYVSTSKFISWRKYCVYILCTSAVVSVFCTVCSTNFIFSIIPSWYSTGGQDIKVLLQVVWENQNGKICFCNSSQNVYVSVGCP